MAEQIGRGYYRLKVSEKPDETLINPLVLQFLQKVGSAIRVASQRPSSDRIPNQHPRLETGTED